MNPTRCALFLIATFTLAGAAHTSWLAAKASRRFALPLDMGKTFRGKRLLGPNKMLRGFMVMVPAAGAAFGVSALTLDLVDAPPAELGIWPLSPFAYTALGLWAGFGFMAGELPNSFVKRQLGIEAGKPPRGRLAKMAWFLVDQCDSLVGMLLAMSIVVSVPWRTSLYVLLAGIVMHWLFTVVLFRFGGKERPA